KVSKRGKPSDQPSRKKAAKRATPNKRPRKTVAKMAPRKPPRQKAAVVEDTIIDVIDEPVPGVVRIKSTKRLRRRLPSVAVLRRTNNSRFENFRWWLDVHSMSRSS